MTGDTKPGPDQSGPGLFSTFHAAWTTLGAALRLAWPTVFMCIGVFASLQATRIGLWNQLRGELRSTGTHSMAPTDIALLAGWWSNAQQRAVQEMYPLSWSGMVRRLIHDRPLETVQYAAVGTAGAYALALLLLTLTATRGTRSQLVPFELSWKDRFAAASRAGASASPWCAVAGALIAAVCWHTGYDRLGRSRLLIDVLPSPLQGGVILVLWAICALLLILFFLPPHARRLAIDGSSVCSRCRYPLRGLVTNQCPECGREQPLSSGARTPSIRERHVSLLRAVAIAAFVLTLAAVVLSRGDGRLANWIRLRPATISWVIVPGRSVLSESPIVLQTIYGDLSVRARRARSTDPRAWTLVWERQGTTTGGEGREQTEVQLSLRSATSPATAIMLETTSGPLWLWQPTDDGPLSFGVPEVMMTVR